MYEDSTRDEFTSRQMPNDQSSVCFDLDQDPAKESQRLQEKEKRVT